MTFRTTKYQNNGNLAVIAFEDDGEEYGTLTVNIIPMEEDCFACLDTNNWPDAEKVAYDLGARPTGEYVQSGFCRYPIYNFLLADIPALED